MAVELKNLIDIDLNISIRKKRFPDFRWTVGNLVYVYQPYVEKNKTYGYFYYIFNTSTHTKVQDTIYDIKTIEELKESIKNSLRKLGFKDKREKTKEIEKIESLVLDTKEMKDLELGEVETLLKTKDIAFKEKRILERKKRSLERSEETKEFSSKVEVGAIFVQSWGYDETHISCYQVIAKNKSLLTLKEISSHFSEGNENEGGRKKPSKDQFIVDNRRYMTEKEPEFHCRISGDSIKIKEFWRAYLWDGQKDYYVSGWNNAR